jgi:hypothetical protein
MSAKTIDHAAQTPIEENRIAQPQEDGTSSPLNTAAIAHAPPKSNPPASNPEPMTENQMDRRETGRWRIALIGRSINDSPQTTNPQTEMVTVQMNW